MGTLAAAFIATACIPGTVALDSNNFAYDKFIVDMPSAKALLKAICLACLCISIYFGTATATKIPKITKTEITSMMVKPLCPDSIFVVFPIV